MGSSHLVKLSLSAFISFFETLLLLRSDKPQVEGEY